MLGLGLLLVLTATLRAENPAPEIEDNDHSPYHVALLNYKSDKFEAALVAINDAEKATPDDIATAILKARVLTELHQFDQAAKALKSLDDNPAWTPELDEARTLAWGDLDLRQRNFDGAAKFYLSLLAKKPGDPDLLLKLIYARVSVSDFVAAGKYASELKPLDPEHPSYYFAKAALAQATGKTTEAEQDIETVRTVYGITTTNHYLETYLQVFAPHQTASAAARAEPPATNAPPTPHS
jgi:tetratricopeptide (TPR) repeat protein